MATCRFHACVFRRRSFYRIFNALFCEWNDAGMSGQLVTDESDDAAGHASQQLTLGVSSVNGNVASSSDFESAVNTSIDSSSVDRQ